MRTVTPQATDIMNSWGMVTGRAPSSVMFVHLMSDANMGKSLRFESSGVSLEFARVKGAKIADPEYILGVKTGPSLVSQTTVRVRPGGIAQSSDSHAASLLASVGNILGRKATHARILGELRTAMGLPAPEDGNDMKALAAHSRHQGLALKATGYDPAKNPVSLSFASDDGVHGQIVVLSRKEGKDIETMAVLGRHAGANQALDRVLDVLKTVTIPNPNAGPASSPAATANGHKPALMPKRSF